MAAGRIHNFAFFLLTFYFLKLINQFESIMQNKPNLLAPQMNVNTIMTVDYENKSNWNLAKTKPIQTQYKPNTKPIPEMSKMNVTSVLTKHYENKPPFGRWENKPNSNPIQTQSQTGYLTALRSKEKGEKEMRTPARGRG